jgi:tripartite-type tricarboxylate transporter receptor subunit TctC
VVVNRHLKMLRLAVIFVFALAGTAHAQTYPSRVITIVVPLPPGGATDTLTRTLAEHMRMTLGQPIIIEPGAGGTLGIARVVRAAPDGYTLAVGNFAAYVAASATYPVRYDVLNDLEGVAKLADTPLWMVARTGLPVQSLKELIGRLKDNPDKASAGIVGFGSGGHICSLSFQNATGTRYEFVPYKGRALAMQDLVAGHIDLMCDMAANALPQARAGTIKPIAVMSDTRWFAAPDVPTAQESGMPGLALSLWHGMWAPKNTPAEIIATLNGAVVKALADPAVQQRYAEQRQEVPPAEQQSPQGFRAFHKAEIEKWWPIIKAANIKNE